MSTPEEHLARNLGLLPPEQLQTILTEKGPER
jgi:hypothetical protein